MSSTNSLLRLTLGALLSFSLLACPGGNNDECEVDQDCDVTAGETCDNGTCVPPQNLRQDQDAAQEEAQLVVDSLDDFSSFELVLGPAIGVTAGAFAQGAPTADGIAAGTAGLLQSLNPCIAATANGATITITWGIQAVCLPGGITHGEEKITVTVNATNATMDVVDTVPLTINQITFGSSMSITIDPVTKITSVTRSLTAIRGVGSTADVFTLNETGNVALDNTGIPKFTWNMDRTLTFNGVATQETVTDLLFQVKVRQPLSGAVHLEGIPEGTVDLDFANDLAGVITVNATLNKIDGTTATFAFDIDTTQNDLLVPAN